MGKVPECRSPTYETAKGCKSTSTLREALCANRRAANIACSTTHTSCSPPSLLASSNLHGGFLRPELDPRHDFRMSSAIILVHFSPCTHSRSGCVNPNLYNSPSIIVNLLEFFFIFLASVGSSGRRPSARHRLYCVIQVSGSWVAQTYATFTFSPRHALILGDLKFS